MTPHDKNAFDRFLGSWMGNASETYSDKVLELAYEPVYVGELDDPDGVGRVEPKGESLPRTLQRRPTDRRAPPAHKVQRRARQPLVCRANDCRYHRPVSV